MDSAGVFSTNGKGCGYGKKCSPIYPVRGVCPAGWHLPDTTEWSILFASVGGPSIAGLMLKSTSRWCEDPYHLVESNGIDAFSFTLLPAGIYITSSLDPVEYRGYEFCILASLWSSADVGSGYAWHAGTVGYTGNGYNVSSHESMGIGANREKYLALPVRCVQD